MLRYFIVFVALFALIPLVEAGVCVSPTEGCQAGIPEASACKADDAFFNTTTNNASSIPACVEGCCVASNLDYRTTTRIVCEQTLTDRTFTETACPVIPNQCLDGQTNCNCGVVPVGAGQVCCNEGGVATPYEDSVCPGDDDPDDPIIIDPNDGFCGDGSYDPDSETCEYAGPGADNSRCIGDSIPDEYEYCTVTCNCAYDEADFTDDPNTCTPDNPNCTTPDVCEEGTGENDIVTLNPITDSARTQGDKTIDVSWSFEEACNSELKNYWIEYRTYPSGSWTGGVSLEPSVRTFTFESGLEAGESYQFQLTADFDGTIDDDSDVFVYQPTADITQGSDALYLGDEVCFTNQRFYARCLDNGNDPDEREFCTTVNILDKESCGGDSCVYYTDNQEQSAMCLSVPLCEQCNVGYDSFGELVDTTVKIGDESYSCKELDSVPIDGNDVHVCYLEFDESALKEYKACAEVISCGGYTSQFSCEDNTCKVESDANCVWNSTIDICHNEDNPLDEESCDLIADSNKCELLSGCALINDECVIESEHRYCERLLTEDACRVIGEGLGDFTMNSKTNEPLTISQNELSLPKCAYIDGVCRQDADGNGERDGAEITDHTNPETLLLATFQDDLLPNPIIPFSATDESGVRDTFWEVHAGFCGDPENYDRPSNLIRESSTIPTSGAETTGDYCLLYYSVDKNRNHEIVKYQNFSVDADTLKFVGNVTIDLEPRPAENVSNVIFSFELSRPATCTFDFNNDVTFTGYRLTQYEVPIPSVEDGQYPYSIDCTSDRGANSSSGVVLVDSNIRISFPFPEITTHAPNEVFTMGILADDPDATCQYFDTEWINFTKQAGAPVTRPTDFGDRTYSIFYETIPNQSSYYHEYSVRCLMSDGETIDGGPADLIRFAIDATPPEMTLTYDLDGVQTTLQNNFIEVGEIGKTLSLSCVDVPLLGSVEYSANYETAPEDITYEINGTQTNTTIIFDEERLSFTCTDLSGNVQGPRFITAASDDISGPNRPDFGVKP